MCGEGAVTDRMCQKWFANFVLESSRWMTLPGLGRPAEVDSHQIQTRTENNQHLAHGRDLVAILKTSKSVEILVKRKTVSFVLRKKLVADSLSLCRWGVAGGAVDANLQDPAAVDPRCRK